MSPLVEELLRQRGVWDFEKFLHPSLSDLATPADLPGVTEAAGVIAAALEAKKLIVIFGDYDCDGVCATAILMRTLRALAKDPSRIESFLPRRLEEGYGMSDAAVARMFREFPEVSLVITVDNGINSVRQVAELKSRGVSVVVTDHHLPGETLPSADAIVNPKVAAPEALSSLCGASVAFLLANELVNRARASGAYTGPSIGGPLVVLAGLATVTDIMPIVGQNRILVASALEHFRAWAPIGLKELYYRAARSGASRFRTHDFSFLLGPRINAAGRLASAMDSLELVMSDDREIAREAARIVDLHNQDRKTAELQMTEDALAQVVEGAAAQVIYLPNGHPGVAGIVAARLLERLGETVPVCVIAGDHGSARSPAGINIRDAFIACQEVLSEFGGHAAAGGFSVLPGKVDEFRRLLCAYCERFRDECVRSAAKAAEPNLWVEPADLTIEVAEELQLLEPFGEGNEEPRFGFRNAIITEVKVLGENGRHLSLTVNGIRAVWWSHGGDAEALRATPSGRDVIFTVLASNYGERHVELRIVAMK